MRTRINAQSNPWTNLTMLLCVLGWSSLASSQTTPSSTRTESSARAMGVARGNERTRETESQDPGQFTGTWRLKEMRGQPDQRRNAIERVVASMGRFQQGRAREMLNKTTAPPRELKITDSGNHVRLTRAGLDINMPTNGQQVTFAGENGNVALRAQKRDGKLIVIAKSSNATNTSVYVLSADGRDLMHQVHIQSDKIAAPIRFTNTYTR